MAAYRQRTNQELRDNVKVRLEQMSRSELMKILGLNLGSLFDVFYTTEYCNVTDLEFDGSMDQEVKIIPKGDRSVHFTVQKGNNRELEIKSFNNPNWQKQLHNYLMETERFTIGSDVPFDVGDYVRHRNGGRAYEVTKISLHNFGRRGKNSNRCKYPKAHYVKVGSKQDPNKFN